MTYRKKKGSDTWHWCSNCSNWPKTDYDQQSTKPTTGEQCNECKGKEASGTCNK